MGDLVSVVVPVYNGGQTIGGCLRALIAQSYGDIEIIVCDDKSADETVDIVTKLAQSDARIRLIPSSVNTGPAGARNRGLRQTRGSLVFFTDDDVLVPPDWIENGLRIFADTGCLGVEGQIIYVSETYRPYYSDRPVWNTSGGHFMMANMAYRRDVLFEVGLLNEAFRVMEDRDLALKVQKRGDIVFSKAFTVIHVRDRRTVKSFLLEARASASWAQFCIINGQRDQMAWFIYRPVKLLTLIFPPLIFSRYFSARFKSPFDYILLLALYPRLWYERILVWKYAIRYKKFII